MRACVCACARLSGWVTVCEYVTVGGWVVGVRPCVRACDVHACIRPRACSHITPPTEMAHTHARTREHTHSHCMLGIHTHTHSVTHSLRSPAHPLTHFQHNTHRRRHHCRARGEIFCGACANHFAKVPNLGYTLTHTHSSLTHSVTHWHTHTPLTHSLTHQHSLSQPLHSRFLLTLSLTRTHRRRHHCRACGEIFCGACANHFAKLPNLGYEYPVRVCIRCFVFDSGSRQK